MYHDANFILYSDEELGCGGSLQRLCMAGNCAWNNDTVPWA